MKTIVRSIVVVLALTGALATTSASAKAIKAKSSAMPVPTCPPGVPGGCGIGTW